MNEATEVVTPVPTTPVKMNKRSPSEWRDIIDTIPNLKMRCKVASIIWFDFFAKHEAKENVIHLDLYVNACHNEPVDHQELINTLVSLGYSPSRAASRVSMDKRKVKTGNGLGNAGAEDPMARHEAGERSLMVCTALQAINDIQMLTAKGVIVDGSVREGHIPRDESMRDYKTHFDILQLVTWVKDGSLADMCEELGLNISTKQLLSKLKMTREVA